MSLDYIFKWLYVLVKHIPPSSWQEKHMENSHRVQVPQRTFAFAFTLCTLGWSEAYHGLFRFASV